MLRAKILFFFFITTQDIWAMKAFCFSPRYSLREVKTHVLKITSPKDKVYLRESKNCLEVVTSSQKYELVERWIEKKYPILTSSVVGQEARPSLRPSRHCRLAVEKVIAEDVRTQESSLGRYNTLRETKTSTSGKSTSKLILAQGSRGAIAVNHHRVAFKCIQGGGASYRVEVSLTTDNEALSTQVVVRKGVRTNLGSIVENLKKKDQSVDIGQGFKQRKVREELTYDYFLLAQ